MTRRTLLVTALLAACGGSSPRPTTPVIRIEPAVAAQTWYRSTTVCGQGPYELEVPIEGVKHGEEVELRVQAPRTIALHAVMIVDGDEVATTAGTFGANGRTGGRPANTRCIADARERLALARPGESGDRGTPLTPGMTVVAPPPPSTPGAPPQLEGIRARC